MESSIPAENTETTAISGAQVLDDVASFIRQYLVCDGHQLTILVLWSAFTHCFQHFSVAPYLNISSPEPGCGKTLCLELLCHLPPSVRYFSGIPAANVIKNLLDGRCIQLDTGVLWTRSTILLDGCHHSLGLSERQPLLALLNSGSSVSGIFPSSDNNYSLFAPKAFAGDSPLPRSLAARCIPIRLHRPIPSEIFRRYQPREVESDSEMLQQRLSQWLNGISSALAQAEDNDPPQLPPTLSLGQRERVEPLLHLADLAGGSWSAKARSALAAVFDLADASSELQLLLDLRAVFRDKNNPEYLATADLLSELRIMDNRPWSAWTSNSGRRLATRLGRFGIAPQHLNRSDVQFRGYLMADFQDAWQRYLPPSATSVELSSPAQPDGNDGQDTLQTLSVLPSVQGISAIDAGPDT